MNQQPPERHVAGDGFVLDVHSMFLTLQGEGPLSGRRAVFIRLAGCNLQCPGCDTLYTEGRRQMDIMHIINEAWDLANSGPGGHNTIVVITGGEPLRQPIDQLVLRLLHRFPMVQIESNGMFAPGDLLASNLRRFTKSLMLVISPKTPKVNALSAELADCFKYVLDHHSVDSEDGLPLHALEHKVGAKVARPPERKPVYLTPYDAKDVVENQLNLRAVARSCIKYGYIANLQLHKYLELE